MPDSNLHKLSALGQSVWIDYLSRQLLKSGKLARMMEEDAVVGVTSNPTIFQKAIAEGDAYDEQLREILETGEEDPKEIFLQLSSHDISDACDLLRKVWDEGEGLDGYVSWEVDPTLAYDRDGTIAQAKRLHDWVDKPNLYVKIPATEPGLGAIEEMIALGKNINVTLIFSLERHTGSDGGVPPRPRTARGEWRRPEAGALGGELLRLACRHGDRQSTRRARRGSDEAQGLARDRQRQARLSELSGGLRGPTLGSARGEGRDEAALPLGVHVDEEPRVPRRHVRRGADRAGDGGHDARGDDGRLPGSRQGRADPDERTSKPLGSCSWICTPPASTTTT